MRRAALWCCAIALFGGWASAEEREANNKPALVCGCPSGLQQGDVAITTVYQEANVTKHFFSTGQTVDGGRIRGRTLLLAVDYALTDRLAMTVSVPYVAARYHGPVPHRNSTLDDGAVHGTLQDLRADLRYDFLLGETHLTPFVGITRPTHSYEYLGHAAPGHKLREEVVGFNIERSTDKIIAGSYVQARYGYSFAEKVLGISHNRSNLDVNLGYFVTQNLSVRGLWSLQKTYGGIDQVLGQPLTGDLFLHHDQLGRADFVAVGAGATYSLNDRVDLFASASKMLHGRNGHKLDLSPTVGMTWSFSTRRAASCDMH
jgi:hypothetical protein